MPRAPKPPVGYAGAVRKQAARTTPAQRAASTAAIGRQMSARYGPNSVTRAANKATAPPRTRKR